MRNPTREVQIGHIFIGKDHPIAVQSMCATKTQDVTATYAQIIMLYESGADIIRVAADTIQDVHALGEIRALLKRNGVNANLSADIQEKFRLIAEVAPYVDKIRYNPGHLYHSEPELSWREKVRWIAETAKKYDIALRIGVNCGSVDPEKKNASSGLHPMLASVLEHAQWLDEIGFTRYCVSLKDSHPEQVIQINRDFTRRRPDIPIHLGLTEAGMPPEGILKTRAALEPLLFSGIGDTLRVSLTVPNEKKWMEIQAGRDLISDVTDGKKTVNSPWKQNGLNIISCPSCNRVENGRFVEMAEKIREMTRYAAHLPITIAVMGCRVNGPGETDNADLGLWCGADHVNLKRGSTALGRFTYDEIFSVLKKELDRILDQMPK